MRTTNRTQNSLNHAMRLYLKEVSKIPLLTVDEEKELGRRAQLGDKEALQKLTESNLRFVIKVAKRYRRSGMPLLDLINEGNVGLMEAARRFNPDRKVRFTSYAVWWIRQAILLYLATSGSTFRLSPKTANIAYRAATALKNRNSDGSGNFSREELAEEVGVSLNELNSSLEATAKVLSFDYPINEEGDVRLGDVLEQSAIPAADSIATKNRMKQHVERSLSSLTTAEQKVLRLRFGLDNDEPLTLKEIGGMMNLSRERIRQIEAHALSKLRHSSSSLATYLN
jgi:RNA polymerase primary sigma factor